MMPSVSPPNVTSFRESIAWNSVPTASPSLTPRDSATLPIDSANISNSPANPETLPFSGIWFNPSTTVPTFVATVSVVDAVSPREVLTESTLPAALEIFSSASDAVVDSVPILSSTLPIESARGFNESPISLRLSIYPCVESR